MPKPRFITQPQRSDGRAYVDCDVHRATSWAVIKIAGRVRAVISRHSTKTQADGEVSSRTLNAEGPPRQYKLGRRMGKLSNATSSS